MRLILQGIDPGIVDTGLVTMTFDFDKKTVTSEGKVWTGVTERKNRAIKINQTFLAQLYTETHRFADVHYVYIEGFRNRGRDTHQDQSMSDLVQGIYRQIGGTIVDNTGVKTVVKRGLLEMLKVSRWPRTNHADLLSASRIALKGAIENEDLNKLLASMVREQHEEKKWEIRIILPNE